MNKLFKLIFLGGLSIILCSCSNSTFKQAHHQEKEVTSSIDSSEGILSSSSKEIDDKEIDVEKIQKINQENFPESQLLSIKSDNYYGQNGIHITSRKGAVRKEFIYNNNLDKKLGSYSHYDKDYDGSKKLDLNNIISLEKAISIGAKAINNNLNINEWKLTYEDDKKVTVWELESNDYEITMNAQTGEVYDVDS